MVLLYVIIPLYIILPLYLFFSLTSDCYHMTPARDPKQYSQGALGELWAAWSICVPKHMCFSAKTLGSYRFVSTRREQPSPNTVNINEDAQA